jgi:hypothetical protein
LLTLKDARNLRNVMANRQQEHGDAFVAIEIMINKPEIMESVVYHQGLPLPMDEDGNLDKKALGTNPMV